MNCRIKGLFYTAVVFLSKILKIYFETYRLLNCAHSISDIKLPWFVLYFIFQVSCCSLSDTVKYFFWLKQSAEHVISGYSNLILLILLAVIFWHFDVKIQFSNRRQKTLRKKFPVLYDWYRNCTYFCTSLMKTLKNTEKPNTMESNCYNCSLLYTSESLFVSIV